MIVLASFLHDWMSSRIVDAILSDWRTWIALVAMAWMAITLWVHGIQITRLRIQMEKLKQS